MNRYRTAFLIVMVMVLGGCMSVFKPIDANFKPKGKTLAVVSGLNTEANELVARHMTDALRKKTRFQVLSQKQVGQSIANYPQNIKGPYRTAYFQIEQDYSKTDIKKVREIQQRLGVDYLYVVWTPTATVMQGKIHMLHAIAQLFEGQSSKEVGNGTFAATAGRTTCCLAPAPGDQDKVQAIQDATEYVAKEIAEKTGMQK